MITFIGKAFWGKKKRKSSFEASCVWTLCGKAWFRNVNRPERTHLHFAKIYLTKRASVPVETSKPVSKQYVLENLVSCEHEIEGLPDFFFFPPNFFRLKKKKQNFFFVWWRLYSHHGNYRTMEWWLISITDSFIEVFFYATESFFFFSLFTLLYLRNTYHFYLNAIIILMFFSLQEIICYAPQVECKFKRIYFEYLNCLPLIVTETTHFHCMCCKGFGAYSHLEA